MPETTNQPDAAAAAAAGTFELGGELTVTRLGYGAMRITGQPGNWGQPEDPENARRLLRRTVELGINLIDTADSYGPGVSEELIAEALYPYPENLVIATKGGAVKTGPTDIHFDGSRGHLREACEASLRRLHVEQIGLYYLHRPDPNVPFEESVGTLAELQSEGKIRHIGLSNVNEDQLAEARRIAPISAIQNRYSLASRDSEGLVELCAAEGIAFIPHGPLGANPFQREAPLTAAGGPLERTATRHGATPGQVALSWLLHHSPNLLPIAGTTSIAHLEENVAAASLQLTEEDLSELGNRD